jgi:hypothetical protein
MPAEKNIHLHPQETNKPYRRIGTIPYRYWDCAGFTSKLEIYGMECQEGIIF